MKTLSNLPFLAAFFIAVAHMPTHVYQICAREVGTLEVEPWRQSPGAIVRSATRALAAFIAGVRWLAGGISPGVAVLAIAALLLAMDASDSGLLLLAVPPVAAAAQLKSLRQQAVDIDAQIASISDEIRTLQSTVVSANRPMNDDEKAKLAGFKSRLTDLKSMKDTTAELLTEAEAANERERAAASVTDADVETARRTQVGRDLAADDPKKGFKDHKDFLGVVMVAGQRGRVDARLQPLKAAQGTDEQSAGSDPHGGFLIPHGVAPGILSVAAEDDFISPLVTPVTMEAPTVSFNARVDKDHTTSVSGGFTVTRRPETVDGTSSRMKFEQVMLTANEEFGLAYATERILNDSPSSFVAIIAAGFKDEYANNAIKERLNGSGVGERLGILHANNLCLVTVAKETGQGADTIVKENIDKMAARCWRYSQAIYIANHDTRPQLRSIHQVVGTGGAPVPYFQTNPDGQEFLDGRPIYFTEHAKKLGDVGDLILCVWSQDLEGTYQQLQSAESIHVRFVAAERCFRFYRRNDGATWWRAALTPANSAATLSPFVTLAAR